MDSADAGRLWDDLADSWTDQVRAGRDIYRDQLNTPAFLAALPPVAGLSGLDIGCGEAANTRALARLGARMCGLDISATFLRHAREAEAETPLGLDFRLGDAQALPFEAATFDFAAAFMSLMDLPDPACALREAARVLRPGGFLQATILHPCFAAPGRQVLRDAEGRPEAVRLSRYFRRTQAEMSEWRFSGLSDAQREATPPFRVALFHRTLSEWVTMILDASLTLEAVIEPQADVATARAHPVVADARLVPISLIFRARKR